MTHLTVLGGTGYAGSHVVEEAASRGLTVTSWSRSLPEKKVDGVDYRIGDVLDPAVLAQVVTGSDVVVGALSPRGALDGKLRDVYTEVARLAQASGVRVGFVGGAGSLRVSADGPLLLDSGFPAEFRSEAEQLGAVLDDLRSSDEALDWFFVSPAANFGSYNPGEKTGTFRVGGDVLLTDEAGESNISGADLATAILNEVEAPAHRRSRFTVAY